jgi:hypothetical protein
VPGEQSFLSLRNGDKLYDAKAAVGLVSDEAEIMDLNGANRRILIAGDWFGYRNGKHTGKVDPHTIIIPDSIAKALGIKVSDIGKANVDFAGASYRVIGILNSKQFNLYRVQFPSACCASIFRVHFSPLAA